MAHIVNSVDLVVKAQEFKAFLLATKNSLDNVISNTDPATLDSLTEIVTAFQAEDGNLTNAINALGTSASSNFAAVNARVDTEIADRQSAVTSVANDLASEITNRQNAVSEVASDLADEVTRATNAESVLTGQVDGINETLETLMLS